MGGVGEGEWKKKFSRSNEAKIIIFVFRVTLREIFRYKLFDNTLGLVNYLFFC